MNMGIIGHVWSKGKFNGFIRDNKIPNREDNEKIYFKYLKENYSIPNSISKNFRMNSVDIVAEIIRDTKSKSIAIIIFESQQRNFINERKIKREYNKIKKTAIVNSLENLKIQNSPDIKTAKEADL